MVSNYLKTAWRSLTKNKVSSFINMGGLTAGITAAMLIGLWIQDEISFDKSHQNYESIARVMQNNTLNGEIQTGIAQPLPLAAELRERYGSDFKFVLMSSGTRPRLLVNGEKKITKNGNYFEPQAPEMLGLKMLKGGRDGLADPYSILLSASLARAFFGDREPLGNVLKIDNNSSVKVTGVYEDLPYNSSFRDMNFIAPWDLYLASNDWIKKMENPWGPNLFQIFVQTYDHANLDNISAKIKLAKFNRVGTAGKNNKPELFLYPMRRWHLFENFENGISSGGRIRLVRLFGTIGGFILMLACINFMNLSTARSEKKAKEVGIRKTIGSGRRRLVAQFLTESLLVSFLAFFSAIILASILIPFFNEMTDKKMSVLWDKPLFWILGLGLSLITGLIAGSYPAIYLSSFRPVSALKGNSRLGGFAAIPRKGLVIFQYTVSIVLLISSITVFRQIQVAENRAVGYDREGLIMMKMITPDIHNQFDVIRDALKKSGAITEMAESSAPATGIWATDGGFEWKGKDPGLAVDFPNTGVSCEFGKTVGWEFVDGRDFSREFASDSSGFVLNTAAVKFMGLKKPVGETVRWNGKPFTVIGVIKDMIVESPYQPARPSLYSMAKSHDNFVIIRLNGMLSAGKALAKIETVLAGFSPATPFDFTFVDEEYAKKFGDEKRTGKLALSFTIFAILICSLGVFGMASFIAEQRRKEIGVRKVLGASVFQLWNLLSSEFAWMLLLAFLIAAPIAWYSMHNWLQGYQYRAELSWWIFAAAGLVTGIATFMSTSFHIIKAVLANPVNDLKTV